MYHWQLKLIALLVTVLDIKAQVITRNVLWIAVWLLTNHPLLVDCGGMVFDLSGEVWQGIEEACDSGVVICKDLDDFWQTKDSN